MCIRDRVEENMAVSMKTPNEKDSEMSDPIRQVRSYLEEHYNEIITRRNIESLVHLNGDYINREFKKCTGYTLMEYIQRYRIITVSYTHLDVYKRQIWEKTGLTGNGYGVYWHMRSNLN